MVWLRRRPPVAIRRTLRCRGVVQCSALGARAATGARANRDGAAAGGRAVIQVVCAGERTSLEAVAMETCRSPRWAHWFDGFTAPFIHVDPAGYGELAASAGLTVTNPTVTDREWDFGSRNRFQQWCAVVSTAWTDRLPVEDRDRFVGEPIDAYETVAGRSGLGHKGSGSPRCGPNSGASGHGRKFVGGLGPGSGVCEVEAAGGVEGVFG